MTTRHKRAVTPASIVIYSSSVEGGYSLLLLAETDLKAVRALCKEMEQQFSDSFSCCTLADLIKGKSKNADANEFMMQFISSVNNGEYEQFENLTPSQLKPKALLAPNNIALLTKLLECCFETGYISPAAVKLAIERGMTVLLSS